MENEAIEKDEEECVAAASPRVYINEMTSPWWWLTDDEDGLLYHSSITTMAISFIFLFERETAK